MPMEFKKALQSGRSICLLLMVAILAGMLAMVTWPIRYLIRIVRYRKAFKRSRIKRCVILELDGMDPKLAKK